MELETNQLILRPVKISDTDTIANIIFSDPDVVAMLAHNTRFPEDAKKEAERWTKVMGIDGQGGIWDDGGIGLYAIYPKNDFNNLAGVAGFYMKKNTNQLWDGEYFYALGSKWHGRRFMSEVADLLADSLASLVNLGTIYACYWDQINEASGRVLLKTGFKPKGRRLLVEEYDEERCVKMFKYDLWRLKSAENEAARDNIVVHTARRAGGFVAESVLEKNRTIEVIAETYGLPTLPQSATDMFNKAISYPGMANLEYIGQ